MKISRRHLIIASSIGLAIPSTIAAKPLSRAKKLVAAARQQIGITTRYDPAYRRLDYPGGDVARINGVCTDVLIRAYRDALGLDLQKLVHEDMKRAFSSYPKIWGLRSTDKNIDHRRVPNLRTFFTRKESKLAISDNADDWQAGDIITSLVGGKLAHCGIISDRSQNGRPLVIHNVGQGAREQDVLFAYKITGHYRWAL